MSALGNSEIIRLVTRLIILLLCFPVHECAHAWMASKLGDPTAQNKGRITLNPVKHLDPWGTAMLFACGVGYAKPVPVRAGNFKNRKRDFALTALAGPVSNLLMAVALLVLLRLEMMIQVNADISKTAISILKYAAQINVSLAVFNLIPIPPLDGSRVLGAFLPDDAYNSLMKTSRYARLALLFGIVYLSRAGYFPTRKLAGMIFRFLYRIIVTG